MATYQWRSEIKQPFIVVENLIYRAGGNISKIVKLNLAVTMINTEDSGSIDLIIFPKDGEHVHSNNQLRPNRVQRSSINKLRYVRLKE